MKFTNKEKGFALLWIIMATFLLIITVELADLDHTWIDWFVFVLMPLLFYVSYKLLKSDRKNK